MSTPDVPDHVVQFLDESKTLTLATAPPGGPPHATTLVYVNDGPDLYIWVHTSTATAKQLQENPKVGFAIDEYAEDWRQTKGAQGTGSCAPVTDGEELAKVGDLFGRKYPELRPGASGAVAFYRLAPSALHFVDNSRGAGDPLPDEYRRESILGSD